MCQPYVATSSSNFTVLVAKDSEKVVQTPSERKGTVDPHGGSVALCAHPCTFLCSDRLFGAAAFLNDSNEQRTEFKQTICNHQPGVSARFQLFPVYPPNLYVQNLQPSTQPRSLLNHRGAMRSDVSEVTFIGLDPAQQGSQGWAPPVVSPRQLVWPRPGRGLLHL